MRFLPFRKEKMLLSSKKKKNKRLLEAAGINDTDTVIALLSKGADMNAMAETECMGINTRLTPLINASRMGCKDVVEVLLNSGADVSVKNSDGRTALVLAKIYDHIEIVELLRLAEAKEQ